MAHVWSQALALFGLSALLGISAQASPNSRAPLAIYEIYPRSFQDSDGDGKGDLRGVISRLDYIQRLGVDAIWLMPIFESPSAHGYDVTDYGRISRDYGDENTCDELLAAAHARGLKLILDVPVNSTSRYHPWFIASQNDILGPAGALYLWRTIPQPWPGIQWQPLNHFYYLSSFGPELPDLNWQNDETYARVLRIFTTWVQRGVDGFRLDAAKHLIKGPHGETNQPQTHLIWQRIVGDVRKLAPQAYFVGEVWDSSATIASYYGGGRELDASFDFPVMYGLRESLKNGNPDALFAALNEHQRFMPANSYASPFAGNHDLTRFASEVPDEASQKLAAVLILTLPGTPTIYYGDEIGMKSAVASGDLAKRSPMLWDETAEHGFTQAAAPWSEFSPPTTSVELQEWNQQSLLNTYRSLLHLRNATQTLRSGSLAQIEKPTDGVVTFWREGAAGQTLVALNFSSGERSFHVTIPGRNRGSALPRVLFGQARVKSDEHSLFVPDLKAKAAVIIDLSR